MALCSHTPSLLAHCTHLPGNRRKVRFSASPAPAADISHSGCRCKNETKLLLTTQLHSTHARHEGQRSGYSNIAFYVDVQTLATTPSKKRSPTQACLRNVRRTSSQKAIAACCPAGRATSPKQAGRSMSLQHAIAMVVQLRML